MNDDRRLMPKGRMEAFSDAVYAIALTLLVLELHAPEFEGRLSERLLSAWPVFLSYLVSFVFIGGSWFLHSNLTRLLRGSDRVLTQINLLLLLCVTFLPFTTGLLADHLTGTDQRLAVVIFGVNIVLADAMMGVVSTYALRSGDLVDEESRTELQDFTRRRWIYTAVLMALTIVGAFVPVVAVVFFLVVSALMLIQPLRLLGQRFRLGRARDRRTSQGGLD